MKKQIKCPYCGNINKVQVEPYGHGSKHDLVTCDVDDSPGCDKKFVITWETTVDVYAFKIEGLE